MNNTIPHSVRLVDPKELGIVLDFRVKMITIDEIILPMRNVNHLQGASTLRAIKLNNSLAMEPKSTQDATKCVTQILDAKYNKADLQSIVKDYYKNLSANQQKKLLQLLIKYESIFGGTLGDWRTKPVSNKEHHPTTAKLSQYHKYPKIPSSKKLRGCVNWGY